MRSCRELLLQSAALLSEHPEFETPSDVASPLTFFAIEKRFGRRHNRRGVPDRRQEECEKEEQDSRVLQERVTDPHCKVQFRSEEEMLSSFLNRHEVTDETSRTFITEVFNGCIRQEKVLKASLDLLYTRSGGVFLRNEYTIFAVLLYLALHRMDELTFPVFGRFVNAANSAPKMYKFISFLFSPDLAKDPPGEKSLRAEWCKIFDASFVTETLANPLLKWFADAQGLLLELKERIEGGMVPKKSPAGAAKPRPFLFTKPLPQVVDTRPEVSRVRKAKPAPKTTYQPSIQVREKGNSTRKKIKERQAQVQQNFAQSQAIPAAEPQEQVQTPEPLAETGNRAASAGSKTRAEPSAGRCPTATTVPRSQLSTNASSFALPMPKVNHGADTSEADRRAVSPKQVKLTVGAILREEALMKKRTAEEHAKVAEAEVLMRDGREYGRWRTEMKLRDEEERRMDAERRRLEVQILHEEAIAVKGEVVKEKHEIAQEVKAKSAQLKELAGAEQHELAQENAKKIEQTQAGYARVLEAKKKVTEENQKKAEEIQSENAAMQERAKLEAAQEHAKKVELIRQIRQLETMPLPRNKAIDLTETAGDGLLSEMSIVELQLRLAIVKEALVKEEEKRRQEILEQKKQQEKAIADKLRLIQEYRIRAGKKSKSAFTDYRRAGKNSHAQTEGHGRRTPTKQVPGVSFTEPTENREPPDVSAANQAKIRKIMALTEKLASKKKARMSQRQQQKRQQALLQGNGAAIRQDGGACSLNSSTSRLHSTSSLSLRSSMSSRPRLLVSTSSEACFSSCGTLSSRLSTTDISRKGMKAVQSRWSELDIVEQKLNAQLQGGHRS